MPKNIADYEPGHSSISEREKQMVSIFAHQLFSTFFPNPLFFKPLRS
jgi:hypothetical protein